MTFDDICKLKVGDVFFECEYGSNLRARVTFPPEVTTTTFNDDNKERRQVNFIAVNTENDVSINYLITEGLEHYGARLYKDAQYGRVNFDDNTWHIPLMGGEDLVYPLGNKD